MHTQVFNIFKNLINYLLDGRLEISNNRAERSIKPFVIGRKNRLFSNAPNGAEANAIYYSLIETAKENGLNPYTYLTHVFRTAPNLPAGEGVEELLPFKRPSFNAYVMDISMHYKKTGLSLER